ncbi:MAG: hypothetical protein PHS59_18615 [Paludibacter sp.]|nr:hypothetical protein [Paludibacter sp.]
MKRQTLLTLTIAIATTMTINAQTIALHSSTGVQIIKGNTALATAYTAAQNGDTLYLSGGSFTPPANFDKKLMIFGAGHYVDSTLATGKTFINGNVTLSDNADLFYLEGVEITGNCDIESNVSVNNLIIKRCKINGQFYVLGSTNPSSNLSLIGNIFIGHVNIQNAINVLITNNIFNTGIANTNGNQISNNIFLNYSSLDMWTQYVFTGSNNVLNNNISLSTVNNAYAVGSGNIFNNNLFVSPSPNYGTSPTTIGNYTSITQAAIFVNQTGITFNYTHDYHLQAPTSYLGTDGSQVGIYGGTFPYKEGAVPLNPHIQFKSIAPTTDANGDLQIQIQVEAQED